MTTTTARWSSEVRRAYGRLVEAVAADPGAAREVADLAVAQGVWRHPLQRPEHYLPYLDPRPVYDPAEFWFCRHLAENAARIRAEVEAVTDPVSAGFLPVEEPLLGSGRWEQVTFWESGQRFDDACARFPVTAAVVDDIPEAAAAGVGVATLSWLYPGTHIVPHCGGSNARLRVHLGVSVPGGARMRVGEEIVTWQEGEALVFDDSFEHEVWHDGDRPRVVLLLDVSHPDLDPGTRDRMLGHRLSFEERVTAFLAERGIRQVDATGDEVRVLLEDGLTSQVMRHLRERGARSVRLEDGNLVFEAGGSSGDGSW